MTSRADYYTQTQKKTEYFSDFLMTFDRSPLSNDLGRITNESSVKSSIRNIVRANTGEWPFRKTMGSDISRSLFENYSTFVEDDIVTSITQAIQTNEPRVELVGVQVQGSQDQNEYTVNISFLMINNPQPISMSLVLQRVR
jgi:phage baseplate assembly protein W